MILPCLEEERSTAHLLNEVCAVGDEDKGSAVINNFLHLLHALDLKLWVTDRKHFVDNKDFRLEKCRHRKREPYIHAAGIALYGGIDELLQASKADNVVELPFHFAAAHAEDRAVEKDVVPTGELGMKTRSDFQQSTDPSPDPHEPRRRCRDSRDDFQQRGFPAPLAPTIAMVSPCSRSKEMSLSAQKSPFSSGSATVA